MSRPTTIGHGSSVKPRVLGVIPARGGSKRVPNKNLRLIRGKPLLAYTTEAASAATSLDTWVVSTDDPKVRDLAISLGAYVVCRPADLATDTATSGVVLQHALEWMETDDVFTHVVCLHPTSPFRKPQHIDDCVELATDGGYSSVASCCYLPEKSHPNVFDSDGYHCPGAYILNASIYVVERDYLMRHGTHVSAAPFPYFMDRKHSLDIDEEIDLKLAELFLEEQNGNIDGTKQLQ